MRDRLIELLKQRSCYYVDCRGRSCVGCQNVFIQDKDIESIADHLIANGVIVPPRKPVAVVQEIENSTDVYCPYCETNLSGLYGEEPTNIIQCYVCGECLDNTKTITREEAEQELKGEHNG